MYKQLAVALTAVVALAACQKKAEAPAPAPAAAPAAAAAPAETAPVAAAPAAPAAGFGVPECDDYVTKYLACIDTKVPAEAREQLRAAFESTRTAWQQAAATDAGRSTLATGCKQATDSARMAMSAYGCTF